ncbi:hypothetical protein CFT9_19025 [Pseudomonas sp. CFT9]|nr:hypothetical protein CFT9_19025 [Pseudomonas sp. CFT9]EPL10973.1 hypothetical protein CF150_14403 [Pseudomonas sp. CF150]
MGDRFVSTTAKDQHPQEDQMGFYRAFSVFQFGVLAG